MPSLVAQRAPMVVTKVARRKPVVDDCVSEAKPSHVSSREVTAVQPTSYDEARSRIFQETSDMDVPVAVCARKSKATFRYAEESNGDYARGSGNVQYSYSASPMAPVAATPYLPVQFGVPQVVSPLSGHVSVRVGGPPAPATRVAASNFHFGTVSDGWGRPPLVRGN